MTTMTSWEKNIASARKHPLMWMVSDHNKKLSPVSAYLNFLHGMLDQDTLGIPTAIELLTSGEHHTAIAYGCSLPVDYPYDDNLFDWIREQEKLDRKPSQSLGGIGYLNGIVLLSSHSIVDITTRTEQIRQAFYEAMPVTRCEQLHGENIPSLSPYIAIHFTLSPQIFESRTLTIEYMLKAWKWWRKEHTNHKRVNNTLRYYVPLLSRAHIKFKAYNETTFILRLEWLREPIQE